MVIGCVLVLAGSRYVSWLPSFSVEVTRVRPPPPQHHQLDAMARQVQAMFPQYPLAVLTRDLAESRSPDLTVDNILEGRLPPPAAPAPTPTPGYTNVNAEQRTLLLFNSTIKYVGQNLNYYRF